MLTLELIELFSLVYTENPDPDPDPDPDPTPNPDPDPDPEPDPDPDDPEMVPMTDLKKVRAESQRYRSSLRKLEAEVEKMTKAQEKAAKDAEIAKLDGVKQAQARTDEANKSLAEAEADVVSMTAKLDSNARSQAVYQAANAAGFLNPEDAILLLDASEIEVVDGETDQELIIEMIGTLAESRPNLLKSEEEPLVINTGPTNSRSRTQPPGPKLTDVKMAERMQAELDDGIKANTISGHAIIKMRRKIRQMQSGPAVQAEREGREARIKRKTGG